MALSSSAAAATKSSATPRHCCSHEHYNGTSSSCCDCHEVDVDCAGGFFNENDPLNNGPSTVAAAQVKRLKSSFNDEDDVRHNHCSRDAPADSETQAHMEDDKLIIHDEKRSCDCCPSSQQQQQQNRSGLITRLKSAGVVVGAAAGGCSPSKSTARDAALIQSKSKSNSKAKENSNNNVNNDRGISRDGRLTKTTDCGVRKISPTVTYYHYSHEMGKFAPTNEETKRTSPSLSSSSLEHEHQRLVEEENASKAFNGINSSSSSNRKQCCCPKAECSTPTACGFNCATDDNDDSSECVSRIATAAVSNKSQQLKMEPCKASQSASTYHQGRHNHPSSASIGHLRDATTTTTKTCQNEDINLSSSCTASSSSASSCCSHNKSVRMDHLESDACGGENPPFASSSKRLQLESKKPLCHAKLFDNERPRCAGESKGLSERVCCGSSTSSTCCSTTESTALPSSPVTNGGMQNGQVAACLAKFQITSTPQQSPSSPHLKVASAHPSIGQLAATTCHSSCNHNITCELLLTHDRMSKCDGTRGQENQKPQKDRQQQQQQRASGGGGNILFGKLRSSLLTNNNQKAAEANNNNSRLPTGHSQQRLSMVGGCHQHPVGQHLMQNLVSNKNNSCNKLSASVVTSAAAATANEFDENFILRRKTPNAGLKSHC